MFNNTAAYLLGKGQPLEIKDAPYPSPAADEIVIRNRAVALNPVDWATQAYGEDFFPWVKYPLIYGEDIAGDIVEVGSDVTEFKVGDRVVANSSTAFQTYDAVPAHMAARIPASMSYERAAVIPLGFSTALVGLFHRDTLALQVPTAESKPCGKTVLVWGGATSVGSNAVQLAVAAGYEVISTASPRNFEYVKKLGASLVFDYSSPTLADDVVAAFSGKRSVGALSIPGPTPKSRAEVPKMCLEIVSRIGGVQFVAMSTPIGDLAVEGVASKFYAASAIRKDDAALGRAVYNNFLSQALILGEFVPAPEPEVVGCELGHIQKGLDMLRGGVSRKKLVVTM